MNNFVYDIPTKVYFGKDQLTHLGEELKKYGKKVLLTYGGGSIKKTGLYDKVIAQIKTAGLEVYELSGIKPNPSIQSVRQGAQLCKEHGIEVVLAVGGGSTIDASKWIAAGACVEHDPWDFFTKWSPVEKALPILSVLTLAATGSEMNGGGVISNEDTLDKKGRVEQILRPKVSFLDPTNTYTVSAYQTACGSADILSHVMEVYFHMDDDLYMLACVMEGLMKTVIKYAPIAMNEPDNYEARANLMWASSWAINRFVNGGRQHAWSCHPMEHQLSAVYDITHGLGLAILTPRWMEYCLEENTLSKYVQFGVNVFGIDSKLSDREIANQAIEKTKEFLFETLGLQSTFAEIGIGKEHFSMMAEKACGGKSINGFKTLYKEDVEKILEMCL
ncbi:MAG: iron-containing alcohol dehydrogenase [Clostridiales bacterium]|nr:iron-containing alcohol dehydrogenase [Clostridiales bacterium]